MPLKRGTRGLLGCAAIIAVGAACGARAGLDACAHDSDCASMDLCATFACVFDTSLHARRCAVVQRKTCDDNNPCTTDACDSATGSCTFTWSTFDLDGDGHHGPLPGFAPGAPGSCGDDCDDTDPRAFPGNPEVCDGVDNDCDGIIDNGAVYIAMPGSESQLSSPDFDWAEPNSFARGTKGQELLASFGGSMNGQLSPYIEPLSGTGQSTMPASLLTGTAAAGTNTSLAWTGDRFGIAWSDRRDGNFEIYFALLDPTGARMAPGDERITVSSGFSLYPSLVWTGQSFAMVWQEERADGTFEVQGQRIALDGSLIGNIVTLSLGNLDDQGPVLASGRSELGAAWVRGFDIMYQTFAFDFSVLAATPSPVKITKPGMMGVAPAIGYDHKGDRYVAAFFDDSPSKRVVYGTLLSRSGTVITPLTDIAESPSQARDPSLFAFGDRVLFVYADDRDQNEGYELYARELSADLTTQLQAPTRLTLASGDSIEPIQSFASNGAVLVLFRDDRGAAPAVFLSSLACDIPGAH